jgi:hypothetical protein
MNYGIFLLKKKKLFGQKIESFEKIKHQKVILNNIHLYFILSN